jgi:hypothetical protein
MPSRLSAPISSNPKVLAEWLERRTGSRNSAITMVKKLYEFYDMEKEENYAGTTSRPFATRARRPVGRRPGKNGPAG